MPRVLVAALSRPADAAQTLRLQDETRSTGATTAQAEPWFVAPATVLSRVAAYRNAGTSFVDTV
ncbi:hypothetical protein ACIBG8_26545 [Nonomuraea sp. NPDC050556]|uniref:hypothetical protein n=1 Tax=Nonomuraea sp. NPDC050556 TaxID=3364369 RepID=UPI003790830C